MSTWRWLTNRSPILDDGSVETRRLELLVALAQHGSMRAVADELGLSTSTVSQQIAALAAQTGAALVEPVGRNIRLTPAGRRLAERSVAVLAALDAALLDLAPTADPAGTVRVAGFASAIRGALLPIVAELARRRSRVQLVFHEHEPAESLTLLAADQIDLALTYDYNLAPLALAPDVTGVPLWTTAWGLGVPADTTVPARSDTTTTFQRFADRAWIGNSRNSADETVLRLIASMAGFSPRLTHTADSLDLVEDLIRAGLGVGLLPSGWPARPGVRVLELADPPVALRAHAVTRRGHDGWAPLSLVLQLLTTRSFPMQLQSVMT